MARIFYMPFHGKEWMSDTKLRRCSAATRGIWLELCWTMWIEGSATIRGTFKSLGKPLGETAEDMAAAIYELQSNDAAEVSPAISVTDFGATVEITSRWIRRALVKRENLQNRKAEQEKSDTSEFMVPKWDRDSTEMVPQNRSTMPDSTIVHSTKKITDTATDVASYSFDDFWREYPRKAGKASAGKAFAKRIKSRRAFDQLMMALAGYRAEIRRCKTDEQYIAHGATFINTKWQDFMESEQPALPMGEAKPMSAAQRLAFKADEAERKAREEAQAHDRAVQDARLGSRPEGEGRDPGSEPRRSGGVESGGVGYLQDREQLQRPTADSKPDPDQCMGSGYRRGHKGGYVAAPSECAPAALQGGRNQAGVSGHLECERRASEPLERFGDRSASALLWGRPECTGFGAYLTRARLLPPEGPERPVFGTRRPPAKRFVH